MEDFDLGSSGPTYIDNGDGTCREEWPEARWFSPGPALFPPSFRQMTWRERAARRWFDARCWIAEKVLRVPVGDNW